MTFTKTIDLNAHVEDLSCEITLENEIPYASIHFHSLGHGIITAIKLNATGQNTFGDILSINGDNHFLIVLQDLSIPKNTEFSSAKIQLPNKDIRSLKIREVQVKYSDETILDYTEPNLYTYTFDLLDTTNPTELRILNIIRKYEKTAVCLPKENDVGWICACGHFNQTKIDKCLMCSSDKSTMLGYSDRTYFNSLIERQNTAEDKQKKDKKHRNVLLGLIGVLLIGLVSLLINASLLSTRVIYKSVREMQNDLQGSWVYRSDYSGNALWEIDISTNTLIRTYDNGLSYPNDINYYPERGYFISLGSKYIVKKVGDSIVLVESGKYEYTKGKLADNVSNSTTHTNPTISKFDEYISENNISLDNSDVQYNMSNNVNKPFTLKGYAELSDYYNYGFDSDIEADYFCLAVTPIDGSYSDMWYIYCHRDSFKRLYGEALESGTIYVQMVCEIPSYRYDKNQQCMADLQFVVY